MAYAAFVEDACPLPAAAAAPQEVLLRFSSSLPMRCDVQFSDLSLYAGQSGRRRQSMHSEEPN